MHLESYRCRLDDVRIDTKLSGKDLSEASLTIDITPTSYASVDSLSAQITLKDDQGRTIRTASRGLREGPLEWTFKSGEVSLWWPIGYGSQPLYSVEVILLDKVSLDFPPILPAYKLL